MPWVSVVVCSVAWALALRLSFERLISIDLVLYGGALMLEFVALVVLRVKEPGLARPFQGAGWDLGGGGDGGGAGGADRVCAVGGAGGEGGGAAGAGVCGDGGGGGAGGLSGGEGDEKGRLVGRPLRCCCDS